MILVSACLLGINTKYDGASNAHPLIQKYCAQGKFIPICPEQLGGLPTPRIPAEIIDGTGQDVLEARSIVRGQGGEAVTAQFVQGAKEVSKIAEMVPITAAILKERSPSCGVHSIYNGDFQHHTRDGQGVMAALLMKQGIPVYSDEELTEAILLDLLK